jgi:MFS family permease
MSLGVLIAQIDTSVVNLAVKAIGTDFKASVTALQWIVDAYNLVYASLLLSAGTLADLYGRRLIFALGIGLFTLGTLVCGLAPDIATLVVGRAVAGLGAALEVPTSLAILTIAHPDTSERTRALGVWARCYGIAMVIGPTAGGVLVDSSGWRSIFLLILPFCAVTLFLVLTSVPESRGPQGRRLDLPGQALAIAALGTFSLAAIEGPRWGWTSTASVAAFSVSIVAAALFFRRQAGARGALVPLPMLRHRVFAACLAVATAMTFGAYAMLFLTPLYFQTARGASALHASVALLLMSLSFIVTSQLSGPITNKLGPTIPPGFSAFSSLAQKASHCREYRQGPS